jgi:hypothetical protein
VTRTISVKDGKTSKNTGHLCGISLDDRFVFHAGRGEWDLSFFQVWEMTGKFLWEFSLLETKFMTCLPDNDTFIVHHFRSISKYSLSSRQCVLSVNCGDDLRPFSQFKQGEFMDFCFGYAKYSQDSSRVSHCNAVVNVRTLQVTLLPHRVREQSLQRPRTYPGFDEPPVFFLPGSQTAIFDKQVFSLVDGNWTLRMSPRAHALPLLPDVDFQEYDESLYVGYNLVPRASGSGIFFGNLAFAFATQASGKSVSVHLQD